ncbi:MAG: hypothetical protein Q8P41_20475 [Pseudomonadota bacterium]|nr:hypothetical protein [Pseudomonadota bacterium]
MISVLFTGSAVVLAVTVALWYLSRGLRARGRTRIARRFPAAEVLLAETLAQSYGQQSRGVTQARGSGALALTSGELFFLLYVPERELHIPLGSVKAVSIVRSHLGKSGGAKLLHVLFTREGSDDAIAWRLPDPDAWKAKIDAMRA